MVGSGVHSPSLPQRTGLGPVKRLVVPMVSRIRAPVVVNSFGRSGSTLVFETIVKSAARGLTDGVRSRVASAIWGEAWDLETTPLDRGRCFKSHDYPPTRRRTGNTPRVVYMFGDPVNAAASAIRVTHAKGSGWLEEHCRHLRVEPVTVDDLVYRDGLRLEAHFDAWLNQRSWRVAMVRYETLPEQLGALERFLGFPLSLPEWRPRQASTQLDGHTASRLSDTYGEFGRKLGALPDFFLPGGP